MQTADNLLARRTAGHVFQTSPHIVLKCPTQFDNPFPEQAEETEESAKKIVSEKAVFRVLMEQSYPHILQCILCVPEGIFLRRMDSILQERLSQSQRVAIPPAMQEQWVQQLTGAVAWLERQEFVHADLRPANILLDADENIQLGSFDATVKQSQKLLVASKPFC
ncbi:hypothetical protein VTK73DRAFT_8410 [Phialemonium thermophilum]|uniref:EKC/KEOPS complex subunit BUD32 n=1 Tax=Phialemonium thermophilum TaxID=223376 RepID=A0ABR3W8T6_9PEZI